MQVEQLQSDRWVLTDEGKDIVKHGSHEARVFYAINPEKGTLQSELMVTTFVLFFVCVCVYTLTVSLFTCTIVLCTLYNYIHGNNN